MRHGIGQKIEGGEVRVSARVNADRLTGSQAVAAEFLETRETRRGDSMSARRVSSNSSSILMEDSSPSFRTARPSAQFGLNPLRKKWVRDFI